MFTCTPFYLANFVFLFEVSLLPFCSTHRFRFLRLPLVSPIGCLVLAVSPRAYSSLYTLHPTLYTLFYGQTGRTLNPLYRSPGTLRTSLELKITSHAKFGLSVLSELDQ